jgi:hypothetical protein
MGYVIKFWIVAKRTYPAITPSILLPLSATFLCKLISSALTNIKNGKCKRLLLVQQETWVCLLFIRPVIEVLCEKTQVHITHQ